MGAKYSSSINSGVTDPTLLDFDVFDDVRANLGYDQIGELLTLLAVELRERFRATSKDPANLAYEAHVMVSAAGALGFVGLSRLCREVEEACRSGQVTSALWTRLHDARRVALCQIALLRVAT